MSSVGCALEVISIVSVSISAFADKVQLRDVDDDCTDSLYFAEDQTTYHIKKGKEGFVSSLTEHFPEERTNLEAYVDAVYRLTDETDLFLSASFQ